VAACSQANERRKWCRPEDISAKEDSEGESQLRRKRSGVLAAAQASSGESVLIISAAASTVSTAGDLARQRDLYRSSIK